MYINLMFLCTFIKHFNKVILCDLNPDKVESVCNAHFWDLCESVPNICVFLAAAAVVCVPSVSGWWSGYRVLQGWPVIEAYSDMKGYRCCSLFGSAIYGLSNMSTAFLFQDEDIIWDDIQHREHPCCTVMSCLHLGLCFYVFTFYVAYFFTFIFVFTYLFFFLLHSLCQ